MTSDINSNKKDDDTGDKLAKLFNCVPDFKKKINLKF